MMQIHRNDMCETHAQIPAIACCDICGVPVCGDCAVTQHGATLCRDGSHAHIAEECMLLGRTKTIFEADLIARNLETRGVRPHRFGPLEDSKGVGCKIYVPNKNRDESHSIVQSLDLSDFITLEHHV